MAGSEVLPRRERISKRREFVSTYERGTKIFGRYSILFAASNDLGHPRIGITVTKKLGKANIRNRVKRWVREVYRRDRKPAALEGVGVDLVVNAKSSAADASFGEFRDDLTRLFQKAGKSTISSERAH